MDDRGMRERRSSHASSGRIWRSRRCALGLALVTMAPGSLAAVRVPPLGGDPELSAALRTRAYVGMWTTHVWNLGRGVEGNWLLGIAHGGYFGATFINSFGSRSLTAGVQRNLVPRSGPSPVALGYRVGIVTGYDERFLAIAGKTPVLPFLQLVGQFDHRMLGPELTYSGLVASVLLSWTL